MLAIAIFIWHLHSWKHCTLSWRVTITFHYMTISLISQTNLSEYPELKSQLYKMSSEPLVNDDYYRGPFHKARGLFPHSRWLLHLPGWSSQLLQRFYQIWRHSHHHSCSLQHFYSSSEKLDMVLSWSHHQWTSRWWSVCLPSLLLLAVTYLWQTFANPTNPWIWGDSISSETFR